MAIQSLADAQTQALFEQRRVRCWVNIEAAALRKLAMLHRAAVLQDLRIPPGNRLEALQGDRKGQHGIRINDQWRVCFEWQDGHARRVEIVDYH